MTLDDLAEDYRVKRARWAAAKAEDHDACMSGHTNLHHDFMHLYALINEAVRAANILGVAKEYGLGAAAIFKISNGNIDPRKA